jgi:hypothetical protein
VFFGRAAGRDPLLGVNHLPEKGGSASRSWETGMNERARALLQGESAPALFLAACRMAALLLPIGHRQLSPPPVNDGQLLEEDAAMFSNFMGKSFEEAGK